MHKYAKVISKKKNKIIEVFTDGSSFNNSRKATKNLAGGIGVFWGINDHRNLSEPFFIKPITNNRAEIYAVIKAIEIYSVSYDQKCKGKSELLIYSDSQYVINTITKWYKGWKARGWKKSNGKPPLNLDLLCHLDNLITKYQKCFTINFKHIKAHKTPPKNKKSKEYFLWFGNNQADYFARQGSIKYKSKGYCE